MTMKYIQTKGNKIEGQLDIFVSKNEEEQNVEILIHENQKRTENICETTPRTC